MIKKYLIASFKDSENELDVKLQTTDIEGRVIFSHGDHRFSLDLAGLKEAIKEVEAFFTPTIVQFPGTDISIHLPPCGIEMPPQDEL